MKARVIVCFVALLIGLYHSPVPTAAKEPENPFADVEWGSWQYSYMKYALDNGWMSGIGSDEAGSIIMKPDESTSREQFVQILYNKEGKPSVDYTTKFGDVPDGEWYTDAILWAYENGIVAGKNDGAIFGVTHPVTREEIVTMLRSYAEYKGWNTTASGDLESFDDAEEISSWAVEHMQWAIGRGIVTGKGTQIDPGAEATRAEAATMLKKIADSYEQQAKAMWIWHVEDIAEETKREELLEFAVEKGINTLYVEAAFVTEDAEVFRAFNRQAHECGMLVEALDGNSEWVRTENHEVALGRIQAVIAFNAATTDSVERFDGIHHDNEPYTLEDWTENAAGLAVEYLALAECCKELAASHDLTYAVDIPMWYESNELTKCITYGGETKPLSHHIIDIADYVTIMAYRDFAEGTDGIIYHSEDEVNYAAAIGKEVVVGVETMGFDAEDADNPEKITFYEEGEEYMNQELQRVTAYYAEGFKGIAIHYYRTYKALGQ